MNSEDGEKLVREYRDRRMYNAITELNVSVAAASKLLRELPETLHENDNQRGRTMTKLLASVSLFSCFVALFGAVIWFPQSAIKPEVLGLVWMLGALGSGIWMAGEIGAWAVRKSREKDW